MLDAGDRVLHALTGPHTRAQAAKSDIADWSHGTTLNILGGAATASSETEPFAGGGLTWEVMPWFAIEGSGAWLTRRLGATAFAADLKAQVGFLPAAVAVPFAEAGVGFYRTSFDLTRGTLPAFYGSRDTVIAPPIVSRVTFSDPTIVLGGGVNVFTTEHVTVTPSLSSADCQGSLGELRRDDGVRAPRQSLREAPAKHDGGRATTVARRTLRFTGGRSLPS